MRSLVLACVVTLFAPMSLAACGGKDPYSPGTKLGTFHVTAQLKQSSCGATPTPWEFDVKLNHDARTLYWVQGGAPIQGEVEATARTALGAQTQVEVRAADDKKKLAACDVQRTDAMILTLNDANAQPVVDPEATKSFTGTLTYAFAPLTGSDCSDQLASAGGGWTALPCQVDYDLSGAFSAAK